MTAPRRRLSPLRQLASDSSLYVVGNVLRRGFSVITMPVFTRYLSPTGYGVLAIVGTIQGLLEVVYELGVASSATRFYYDCRDDAAARRTLFGTLLVLSLGVTGALTALLLAGGPYLWGLVAPTIAFAPYGALTIVTVFLGTLGILPRVLFRVRNQVPLFFRLSLTQTALTVTLSIGLVVFAGSGPLGPILATFLVAALFAPVYLWYLRSQVRIAFDWTVARRALRFGLPDIPFHLGGWTLKVIDRLILQHYTSLSVVGVYSVGYALGKMPFDLVGNGIHWALVPFFYATATDQPEARSKILLAQVATYNVAILAAIGLATVAFGQELTQLFASRSFADAAAVIPLIAAGSFLQASCYIPSKSLYLKEKTIYFVLIVIGAAGINVALNFLLIPTFGMMGAAWSTLVSYAATIVLVVVVGQRCYPIPYEYGRIAKVVLVACLLAGFGMASEGASLWSRLGLKGVYLVLFPILLALVGFFTPAERHWLRARAVTAVARLARA